MDRYQAYPKYKDSSIDWMGKIPSSWSIFRLSNLFRRVKETGFVDEELLSVYRDYGVIPKSSREDNFNKPSDDLSPYQLVRKNDMVLNKMKAWQGSIAISEYKGIVSPAYFTYRAEENTYSDKIYPKYLHYLLRSPTYIAQYLRHSKGIRVNQWDLDPEQFKTLEILIPSKVEQEKIAKFLDYETAKIDHLIEKQQQLIELLKEKRQAVISHAVTRGLDPKVKMKDSGVEWLSEVPEHWNVIQIKYLVSQLGGGTPSKDKMEYWEGDIPWVSPKDMKHDYIEDAQDKITKQAVIESSAKYIPQRSVLLVVRGMILIHSVPVALSTSVVTINQDMKALVPNKQIHGEYLLFLLKGFRDFILDLVDSSAHGTRVLRTELFERMFVAIPPNEEQLEILQKIKKQISKIDLLIKCSFSAIDLLQERRTALISAAVTGKIDVRNWNKDKQSTG